MLLLVIAGMGYRSKAWLLEALFHVNVSKSALQRWVEHVASTLPGDDEMIQLLNQKKPIQEGNEDEIFPRGMNHCVLVILAEHGRILGTDAVDKRDEKSVKPFLSRFNDKDYRSRLFTPMVAELILMLYVWYLAKKYLFNLITFTSLANSWRHLWKWAVAHLC
jgi:hypothetical protein